MTFRELQRWVALEVGAYHHTSHSALGKLTPTEAWDRFWRKADGTIGLPQLIADRHNFVCGMLPSEFRGVQRTGVHLHGLRYWDPLLTPMINDKERRRVHYRQDDLSKIFIYWEDHYLTVPWLDRTQDPMAWWELRDVKRVLALNHDPDRSEKSVFRLRAAQRQLVDEAAKTTKRARRKQAMRPAAVEPKKANVDYSAPAPLVEMQWGDVP
jgi:putative transposase